MRASTKELIGNLFGKRGAILDSIEHIVDADHSESPQEKIGHLEAVIALLE